jgi:hypothetical protein
MKYVANISKKLVIICALAIIVNISFMWINVNLTLSPNVISVLFAVQFFSALINIISKKLSKNK